VDEEPQLDRHRTAAMSRLTLFSLDGVDTWLPPNGMFRNPEDRNKGESHCQPLPAPPTGGIRPPPLNGSSEQMRFGAGADPFFGVPSAIAWLRESIGQPETLGRLAGDAGASRTNPGNTATTKASMASWHALESTVTRKGAGIRAWSGTSGPRRPPSGTRRDAPSSTALLRATPHRIRILDRLRQ
jgi:hypothetical protein